MTAAYYNENDKYAAAWLRNLIAAGHIAPGDVDDRSIEDVRPSDLIGYTQCHFFAGIGVWSYALRRAGWPDDRPVWTGSCPCQPFSAAGRRGGTTDKRHLYPTWGGLIAACRPPVVFGEQVASKDGLAWLDIVYADLEAASYTVRAVDLCAAGVGAPHIRQRLWFVADRRGGRERLGDAERDGSGRHTGAILGAQSEARRRMRGVTDGAESAGATRALADADGAQLDDYVMLAERNASWATPSSRDWKSNEASGGASHETNDADEGEAVKRTGPSACNGFWRDADWIPCRDGKARPVEPGTFPLAHGAPARVGRLRAYGNAVNAEAATAFIASYIESRILDELMS